jgi:hypothetical protein
VGSIRAIWAVQDKLALDADEEKLIQLKREMVNGAERTAWNPALSMRPQDFEFSEVETARIKAAIQTWDSYTANADRRWLQPLVEALFSTDDTSGTAGSWACNDSRWDRGGPTHQFP